MSGGKKMWAERLMNIKISDNNTSVELDQLMKEHNALDLSKFFPDFLPSQFITLTLAKCASDKDPFVQQYTRNSGHPSLVKALAKMYSPIYKKDIDPMTEVFVTRGASNSVFHTVMGLVNPGEEAIIIDPATYKFEAAVHFAEGIPVNVPLRPVKSAKNQSSADWKLDEEELAAQFSSNTKVMLLSNPNFPLGKVYSQDELEMIANLCIKHDVICISDEVYEWMIYPGQKHIKIATVPGMWDRTITIGSACRTFGVTGWKLGWSVGPAQLLETQHFPHYEWATPIQEAVTRVFEFEQSVVGTKESYFVEIVTELLAKRRKMAAMLTHTGMVPSIPDGGYFMIGDASSLGIEIDEKSPVDKNEQIVRWLVKNKRIGGIPLSTFFIKEYKHLAENYVCFSFFKDETTLSRAEEFIKGS